MKTRSIKYLTTSIFWYLVKMWSVLFLAKFSYLDCWKRDLFYFCQDFYFWHQVKTWSVFISGNIWQRGIPFLHFSGKFHQSSCTLQPTMAKENYCNYVKLFQDNQQKTYRMNKWTMGAFTVLQQHPVLFFVRRSLASLSTGVHTLETNFFLLLTSNFHCIIDNWL